MRRLTFVWSLLAAVAFIAAVIALNASPAVAQNPPTQDMMKMREQMMSDMKTADATLEALVKEMNNATGSAKVDAVAAVVTELVRQHRTMHNYMGRMHDHMLGGWGRGGMMRRQ